MFEFHNFDRCHLTVVEQHALFKKGLEDELARATAHLTAPLLASRADRHNHKVMAAAYRIVARVPHDTAAIPHEIVESEIDDRWTPPEIMLLWKVLQFLVTPMSVSRTSAKEDLQALGAPVNDGTCREGRSHLLRGYAEAHLRVGEAHARGIDIARLSPIALLDENWSDVAQTIAAPPTVA